MKKYTLKEMTRAYILIWGCLLVLCASILIVQTIMTLGDDPLLRIIINQYAFTGGILFAIWGVTYGGVKND